MVDQAPHAFIPYGRQCIEQDDIDAVVEVLRSDWLTTGPKIEEFEQHFADYVGAKEAVAVCNGTAALHTAMSALDVQPGDEAIVPDITFAASANCVIYQGGTPVLVDVDPDTLLIDSREVEKNITSKTKAVIAVDYAGQPCDYDPLKSVTQKYGLALIADGCHALGATYKDQPVGSIADLTAFSFHPVKHITTGEGGMITTDDADLALRMRQFRNHGIATDHRQRSEMGTWYYEMQSLGFNYRITDIQCALGIQQLKKFPGWLRRRQEIAALYDEAFADHSWIKPLQKRQDRTHAYHLYVVRILSEQISRRDVFSQLRDSHIGVNVHYIPVHWHPYYKNKFGYDDDRFKNANDAYDKIISLPMYSSMSDQQVEYVIQHLNKIIQE